MIEKPGVGALVYRIDIMCDTARVHIPFDSRQRPIEHSSQMRQTFAHDCGMIAPRVHEVRRGRLA